LGYALKARKGQRKLRLSLPFFYVCSPGFFFGNRLDSMRIFRKDRDLFSNASCQALTSFLVEKQGFSKESQIFLV
jgi:hypothetical protein